MVQTDSPVRIISTASNGLKLFSKEEFFPNTPNKFLFVVGPAIAISTALMTSAVIPWGDRFHLFGRDILLQATDIDVALLYIFGVISVGVYGIMIGGWASIDQILPNGCCTCGFSNGFL